MFKRIIPLLSLLVLPAAHVAADEASLVPEAVSSISIAGNAGAPTISNALPVGETIYTRARDFASGAVRGNLAYLRFNLSALSSPAVQSATLTLTRVGNDSLSTGRVAIFGLKNLAGNTDQNWDTASFPPTGAEMDFSMFYDLVSTSGASPVNLANVADFSADETISGNTVTLSNDALVQFLQERADDNDLVTFMLCMPSQGGSTDKAISYASHTYSTDPTLRPTLAITYYDSSRPQPPQNLHVVDIQFSADPVLHLEWDAVTDAINYEVYRRDSDETDPVLIAIVPTTAYYDTDVELLGVYAYSVAAVTATDKSIPCTELEVTIADSSVPRPSVPADIVLTTAEPDTIALAWSASTDTLIYEVYRSTLPDREFALVGKITEPAITDATDIVGYQTYYYTIAAVGPGGISAFSTPFEVGPRFIKHGAVPRAPKGLAVTTRDTYTITLAWEPSDNAQAYYLYRSTHRGSDYQRIKVVETNTATDDYAIHPDQTYFYVLRAIGEGGFSRAPATCEAARILSNQRQMELLDRALVAVQTDEGVFLSWRLLGTDPDGVGFNLYRDGRRINRWPLCGATNYLDPLGDADSTYRVEAFPALHDFAFGAPWQHGGSAYTAKGPHADARPVLSLLHCRHRHGDDAVAVLASNYVSVPLQVPEGGTTPDGVAYTYSANDASVGDLDGDGEYEIVLKWDPSNSQDNANSGYTGNVYIDAYEMDGTLLWRIDLGHNIRAGAHYTQFMVYDLDGDGLAEMICKTADGTTDAAGTIIGDGTADWRNTSGYILDGPEYLTLFDGLTGAIVDTIDYVPPRGTVSDWGDSYGNRVDRFLAGVAYFDGEHPSYFACRGQYRGQNSTDGRTVIAAFDVVDRKLVQRWVLDSLVAGREWAGQGHHELAVGDADGDGKDEIMYGGMVVDDDGTGLYTTGLGTGDALHFGDFDPTRPGLEFFAVKEEVGQPVQVEYRDPATGALIWGWFNARDTGRGLTADIDPTYPGEEVWGAANLNVWSAQGDVIGIVRPSINFATWWDGDLQRELTDGNSIRKWDRVTESEVAIMVAEGCSSNNGTKATPCLQADLLGDWREEVVFRTDDSSELRIFTTTDLTVHRIPTLMHDPIYRLAIAWQNNGYNQPPHPSFFIGNNMATPPCPQITVVRPKQACEPGRQ